MNKLENMAIGHKRHNKYIIAVPKEKRERGAERKFILRNNSESFQVWWKLKNKFDDKHIDPRSLWTSSTRNLEKINK